MGISQVKESQIYLKDDIQMKVHKMLRFIYAYVIYAYETHTETTER